jgi:2-methylcitrate dehydratase PrpD
MERALTAEFSKFIKSLSYASIPQEVVRHAKRCILDTIGCGLFGSKLPWNKILMDGLREVDQLLQAPIWGVGSKYSITNAALINGTMVHSFELDDLHSRGIIHPGSVTVPPAMALATHLGNISGKKLIEAIVAGYEIGARVGMFVGTSHLLKGFHPTGTCGTFAAAAAAGKLLNLSENELTHALGIAGAQSAGLMAAQYSSMVKRMHAGRAAQSGLLAALLARKGFTGATDILEAKYGGFGTTMSDQLDFKSASNGLGFSYEVLNVGFKPYSCCGSNHTSLDGLKQIFKENEIHPEAIEKIDIRTTKATKIHVGWPYSPESVTSAQMNLYYSAAAFVLEGDAFIDQFTEEKIKDPKILNYIPRIQIEEDPDLDAEGPGKRHSVRVGVFLKDGRHFERRVDYPLGNPKNPMTPKAVENKFRKLTAKVFIENKVDQLISTIDHLDEISDASQLNNLLI